MNEEEIRKLKSYIADTFDQSPQPYQSFEDKARFFRNLSEELLHGMDIPDDARILDVGCGTGASSFQICEALPRSRVWGLDISEEMIRKAREIADDNERVRFVVGDGSRLGEYFDFTFDAIVYSASIFLIPDYRKSLSQAVSLLRGSGILGLTFMDGVYDEAGRPAFLEADKDGELGVNRKRPVDPGVFQEHFKESFPQHSSWTNDFQLPHELLLEFFSVPAMSSALFARLPYPQRVEKVKQLFDRLPDAPLSFRWRFMVGRPAA